MKLNYKIAVLITCHNRREKTLQCLQALFDASLERKYIIDVYLVDDGSTDGTGDAVKERFPMVKVIQGNGNLFWNQGMRLAWDNAAKSNHYDFYLWLNDDVLLFEFALQELLQCQRDAAAKNNKAAIVAGAFQSSFDNSQFSYGGRDEFGQPIIPNGELQACKTINGNAVLVPKIIYDRIGNLSPDYTHSLGDFDYGLRANNAGFRCYTTKSYIGVCPRNEGMPSWCNPNTPIISRLSLLHSPKGLNISEYYKFVSQHRGKYKALIENMKVYFRVFFPKLHTNLKK